MVYASISVSLYQPISLTEMIYLDSQQAESRTLHMFLVQLSPIPTQAVKEDTWQTIDAIPYLHPCYRYLLRHPICTHGLLTAPQSALQSNIRMDLISGRRVNSWLSLELSGLIHFPFAAFMVYCHASSPKQASSTHSFVGYTTTPNNYLIWLHRNMQKLSKDLCTVY